jgi:tetratricopeptide (TPR) repeat protein
MQLDGNDPFLWTAQAKLQALRKQFLAAKQSVARALQIKNSFAWAHGVNGLIEAQQNNHKEARESFEFALQLESSNLDVLYDYSVYLIDTRFDLDKAERLIRRRMIIEPDVSVNYELHGRVLVAAKELKEAEEAFRTAVRLDAANEKAYLGLAQIELFHRRNAFAAVDWLRPALILNPDSYQLRQYFNVAQTDKNSLYGFLWKSGLFYGANVKWNWFLLLAFIVIGSLYFYLNEIEPMWSGLYDTFIILYIIYCLYCWSSRLVMRVMLEKRWLN